MTDEEIAAKRRFDNLCTCGGYAHTMNGRPAHQPHMDYCPQAMEYAEWFAANERVNGGKQ